MPHLSQLIAIKADKVANENKIVANAKRLFGAKQVFNGFSRQFIPNTVDEKERREQERPPEVVRIQATTQDILVAVKRTLIELFDLTASIDVTNTKAHADITVNGVTIAEKVPAVYLLFLEKKLAELHSFCSDIPTLDPSKEWKWSEEQGYYVVPGETFTVSTKKVMKSIVLYEATDKHPAQVQTYNEDVAVGRNVTKEFSGAMSPVEHKALMSRIEALQQAVKFAREEANRTPAELQYTGTKVLNYVFGELLNR